MTLCSTTEDQNKQKPRRITAQPTARTVMARDGGDGQGQREGGNMHRTTDKQLIRHTSPQKRKTLPPQISHRDRMPAHEKPTEGAAKQEMNASPRAVAAPENQQSTAHTRSADHSQRPSLQHTLTDQQLVIRNSWFKLSQLSLLVNNPVTHHKRGFQVHQSSSHSATTFVVHPEMECRDNAIEHVSARDPEKNKQQNIYKITAIIGTFSLSTVDAGLWKGGGAEEGWSDCVAGGGDVAGPDFAGAAWTRSVGVCSDLRDGHPRRFLGRCCVSNSATEADQQNLNTGITDVARFIGERKRDKQKFRKRELQYDISGWLPGPSLY
ncbi:hypothetical protein SISNIDRAFT_469106 [Sistotremastrum niveocremeum HHB9708]|uniref:Uncharacterized protein n=1 Tax=Sistotremastrum niveocremeum HHB9708 TaxID=1314777 RepID=A0A164QE65_9AGAM|nr:hypothetical protein SISNIDRAFT_469106 [Sistotremastrum niveocremeum HHB9708]